MASPEKTLRLFIAVPIPDHAKQVIFHAVEEFHSMKYPEQAAGANAACAVDSDAGTVAGDDNNNSSGQNRKKLHKLNKINWVAPKNYHITLRFIGDVPISRVPLLIDAIRACIRPGVRDASGIRLRTSHVSCFPVNRKQPPRVLFAQVVEEQISDCMVKEDEKSLESSHKDKPSVASHKVHHASSFHMQAQSPQTRVWTLSSIKSAVDIAVDRFLDTTPSSSSSSSTSDSSAYIPHVTIARCNASGQGYNKHNSIACAFLSRYGKLADCVTARNAARAHAAGSAVDAADSTHFATATSTSATTANAIFATSNDNNDDNDNSIYNDYDDNEEKYPAKSLANDSAVKHVKDDNNEPKRDSRDVLSDWFPVTQIILFRSDLANENSQNDVSDYFGRSGSTYTPLSSFEFE